MTDAHDATEHLRQTTRFDPAAVEARLMQGWLQDRLFHAEPDPARVPYSIVIPPPNVTGKLHMGHALNGSIQDVLTRYHRMLGENACWLVGTDHAGIATQNVVEKMLRAEGLTKEDLGREAFAERVWQWRREYGGTIIRQLKSLGCACDYERERFTFDEGYAQAVTHVFVALYEKGYIYKDSYLVNWCPRCGTAISDLEVAYRDMPGTLNYIRYPVDGGGSLTIATTRPGDHAGRHRRGRAPGRRALQAPGGQDRHAAAAGPHLRIVADERVDPSFGTGALKITPAHDLTDFDIGRTARPRGRAGHRPGRPHHRRRRSRTPAWRSRKRPSVWSPTCAPWARSRKWRTTPTAWPPATAAARLSSRSSASSGSCAWTSSSSPPPRWCRAAP